ncbi:MAG: hypothetical protein RH951_13095 [Parvibaculum sp.]
MRMPPPFLLVKNDHARLAFQTVLLFDGFKRTIEGADMDALVLGRVQGNREQVLSAFRPLGDGFRFAQRADDIIRHEAANVVYLDMLVFFGFEEMQSELFCAAAL